MRLLYPAITAVGLFLAGCSAEYWTGKTTMRTELSVRTPMGGLHFIDTKDNDIDIQDAQYDPQTRAFRLGRLSVHNTASAPIQAEIERIRAIGEAQLTQVAYVQELLSGISGIVRELVPIFGQMNALIAELRQEPDRMDQAIRLLEQLRSKENVQSP